jgi:hypothetical protein
VTASGKLDNGRMPDSEPKANYEGQKKIDSFFDYRTKQEYIYKVLAVIEEGLRFFVRGLRWLAGCWLSVCSDVICYGVIVDWTW